MASGAVTKEVKTALSAARRSFSELGTGVSMDTADAQQKSAWAMSLTRLGHFEPKFVAEMWGVKVQHRCMRSYTSVLSGD